MNCVYRQVVDLLIKKITHAPDTSAPQPYVESTKNFMMSPNPLYVEARLDKEVGDRLYLVVGILRCQKYEAHLHSSCISNNINARFYVVIFASLDDDVDKMYSLTSEIRAWGADIRAFNNGKPINTCSEEVETDSEADC